MMIGVDVAKTATVMFAVKLWDAVKDALFGLIFDKVKFKKGKCLPWLRISTALLPISTVLLFVIPRSAGETVKLAWFAVAYILWDTAYTVCDVPIYSLVTTMTGNLSERNTLMSFGRVFSGLGGGIAMVLCTVLASETVGVSFGFIAVIISTLGIITMLPLSATGVMAFMFTPDCAEYGKYKTGRDAKGITFAIQTFSSKVGLAVSSSLAMIIVGWFGWQTVNANSFEELERLNVVQPDTAIEGLWITYILVPAIGLLLSLIPLAFYKLRDKDVRIMAKCNFGEITREEAEAQLSRKY